MNFQAAAGSWFSTGSLRSICWQLSDNREVNLELWVMDRGKAGDGQARGRQMAINMVFIHLKLGLEEVFSSMMDSSGSKQEPVYIPTVGKLRRVGK